MNIVVAIDSPESGEAALKFLVKSVYGEKDRIHLVHVIVPGFAEHHTKGSLMSLLKRKRANSNFLIDCLPRLKKKSELK